MRKARAIRLKKAHAVPRLMATGDCLSRRQALGHAARLLASSTIHTEALRLIELFHISPEELSEAGLPYETLKCLERRLSFL